MLDNKFPCSGSRSYNIYTYFMNITLKLLKPSARLGHDNANQITCNKRFIELLFLSFS